MAELPVTQQELNKFGTLCQRVERVIESRIISELNYTGEIKTFVTVKQDPVMHRKGFYLYVAVFINDPALTASPDTPFLTSFKLPYIQQQDYLHDSNAHIKVDIETNPIDDIKFFDMVQKFTDLIIANLRRRMGKELEPPAEPKMKITGRTKRKTV